MSDKVDPDIVRLWISRLRSGTESEKTEAASELSRLHIRTRGSVRTRGGLGQAAPAEFASEKDRQDVLAALQDESPAVRREVAFALGEWGDQSAAAILCQLVVGAKPDPAEEVQRAAIAALGTIGGPIAVEALCQAAEADGDETIRYRALAALTELVLHDQPPQAAPAPPLARTRGGTVRPRSGLGTEARRVLETLQRIRDKKGEKEYLRRVAEAALAPLAE